MYELVGMAPDEGAMYRLLLRTAAADPAELADQLRIPAADVVTQLHAMERKGLVTRVVSTQDRFCAVRPELAFAPELAQRRSQLETVESIIGRLGEEHRSHHASRGADELIEVVYGRDAVAHRFAQLQLGAEREVLGLLREPIQAVPPSDTAASQAALDSGVEYRTVYDLALLDVPGDPYEIASSLRRGEDARAAIGVPVKMVMVDREVAIVPLEVPARAEASAIVVHSSGLLDALAALFQRIWATATPLSVAGDGSVQAYRTAAAPSPADRQLLNLLVAGLTDQAIATQLGTSMRTVQRRVRDLSEFTGVRTRLQLVWQATLRGWLMPPGPPERSGEPG
ncbi:helix-turn-helix domain-containing protein [Actinocatenispora sera]|uniref:helix-turn-helix domain-containing protein n=1 Tax=Actinocatenispora sera TaxID=390989 RepID=UPI0033E2D080